MVLKCDEVRLELSDFVDGNLDSTLSRCAAVESHLASCPRCTSLVAGMRNVVRLASDPRAFPPPAGFSERLHHHVAVHIKPAPDVIRAVPFPAAKPSRYGNRFTTSLVWATAAATLLAAVSLVRAQYPNAWRPKSRHSQPAIRVAMTEVSIDPKGKLFHIAQCPFLVGKAQLVSCSSAVRMGYTPCVRCEGDLLKRKPADPEQDGARLPQEKLEISALRRQ